MEIRDYAPEDGPACHELRRAAFLGPFSAVLSPEAARMGANSYSAAEFGERVGGMTTHVATSDHVVVGFCTIRQDSVARSELVYLYVGQEHRGRGIGTALIAHAERYAMDGNADLDTIYLETAVPTYNQTFWERMGYRYKDTSTCEYPTGKIPSVRMEKRLRGRGRE